jgi:hypothetical protein
MWSARETAIDRGAHVRLFDGSLPLTFRRMFELFEREPAFADWYAAWLADRRVAGVFWEHPPLTTSLLERAAEVVLIDGPALDRIEPDRAPFAGHFADAVGERVVSFENLGRDALLVVPCPVGPTEAYGHLASFVRSAPPEQVRALFRRVASAMLERASATPIWLSTAGMGVAWLHVRLDARPKYYRHRAYLARP